MVAKIIKRNETGKLSKDYFLSFSFLLEKWQNATSIDFPKCGDLHLMNPTNSDSMWLHTPDEVFFPQKYTNIKIIGGYEYGKTNNVNSTKSGI